MNDSFDRNMVLLIFFVAIVYLNFLTVRIRSNEGWTNLTCNPLNLFSKSLFQPQEVSNKDFQKCIVNLSAATTTNLFKEQRAQQEKVVTEMTGMIPKYTALNNKVDQYKEEIKKTDLDYTTKINAIKESQKKADTLNTTTTDKISKYLEYLQNIFSNITDYIQKK
jgi:hypothetical protein